MPASYRTVKPSVGSGSLDRDAVRGVLAEIREETPPVAGGGGEDRELMNRIRLATAEHIRQASLHVVARQVGMSPTALKRFLEGATAGPATHRRLRSWYMHQGAGQAEAVSDEDAFNALSLLVRDLPPDARARAIRSILHEVESEYSRTRRDPPAWLFAMRGRFGTSVDPRL